MDNIKRTSYYPLKNAYRFKKSDREPSRRLELDTRWEQLKDKISGVKRPEFAEIILKQFKNDISGVQRSDCKNQTRKIESINNKIMGGVMELLIEEMKEVEGIIKNFECEVKKSSSTEEFLSSDSLAKEINTVRECKNFLGSSFTLNSSSEMTNSMGPDSRGGHSSIDLETFLHGQLQSWSDKPKPGNIRLLEIQIDYYSRAITYLKNKKYEVKRWDENFQRTAYQEIETILSNVQGIREHLQATIPSLADELDRYFKAFTSKCREHQRSPFSEQRQKSYQDLCSTCEEAKELKKSLNELEEGLEPIYQLERKYQNIVKSNKELIRDTNKCKEAMADAKKIADFSDPQQATAFFDRLEKTLEEVKEWNKEVKEWKEEGKDGYSPKMEKVLQTILASYLNQSLESDEESLDERTQEYADQNDIYYQILCLVKLKERQENRKRINACKLLENTIPTLKAAKRVEFLKTIGILSDFSYTITYREENIARREKAFVSCAEEADSAATGPLQRQIIESFIDTAHEIKKQMQPLLNEGKKVHEESLALNVNIPREKINSLRKELESEIPENLHHLCPIEYLRRHEGGKKGWRSDLSGACVPSSLGTLLQDWLSSSFNASEVQKKIVEVLGDNYWEAKSWQKTPNVFAAHGIYAIETYCLTFKQIQKALSKGNSIKVGSHDGSSRAGHASVIDKAFERKGQRYLVIRDTFDADPETHYAQEIPYELLRPYLDGIVYIPISWLSEQQDAED